MKEQLNINGLSELRAEHYAVLFKISEMLNAVDYQETLIAEALDLAIEVSHAERGLFARFEKEQENFTIIAARNFEHHDIRDLSEFSSGILKRIVSEKQPFLFHDVRSDPNVSQFKSLQIHNITSVIGVPILMDETVWGAIVVDSRQNRAAFTDDTLRFLSFFSNLLSLSLTKIESFESLRDENDMLRNKLEATHAIPNMVGESPAMRQVAHLIHRVAKTDATVLLLGESGTGKDLAARAVHDLSKRMDKPYLAQFCGSIPDTLLESELFGYKRGAFTGATADKKGLFEVASGGTFFLDEIAEISMALQAKLLRVLQNREIIRLGDTAVKKIDLRIITATNKNLKELVAKEKFRQDLFYRLNVFPITIPPLRERRSDVALLTKHFIAKHSGKPFQLSPTALVKLENYSWPGNVRQLENVLQRAFILCDGDKIQAEHIMFEEEDNPASFKGGLKDFEILLLKQRLKEFNDNRTQTAKSLGVSVRWIQLKLKEIEEQEGQDALE